MQADRFWRLSHHAQIRLIEMDLEPAAVYEVLSDPEVRYSQSRYGPDNELWQRGDLSVAVNARTGVVITVLWRRTEQWTRDEFRARRDRDSE